MTKVVAPGKCLQGCGRKTDKNFCSTRCRQLYDIFTWGEGDDIVVIPEHLYYQLRNKRMTK
jgi:hypothetical protein